MCIQKGFDLVRRGLLGIRWRGVVSEVAFALKDKKLKVGLAKGYDNLLRKSKEKEDGQ